MALPPREKQKIIQPPAGDSENPLDLAPEVDGVYQGGGATNVPGNAIQSAMKQSGDGSTFDLVDGDDYTPPPLPEIKGVTETAGQLSKLLSGIETKKKS